MWGTDWTRAVAFPSDSDRATLMGGTLQKVYNWARSKQ
jgi:hypothetical protein